MNGNLTQMPPNMSGSHRRSGSTPSVGLIPTITSSLRSAMMYNRDALTQAISQIEAIGDIQNELVNARAAHAQASKDLQICMERNLAQSRQLLQTQDELRVVTQNLHGAREQLGLLESRLASVDGKALTGQGAQQNKVQALESSLSGANQQIIELTKKLQMATSAAIAAQRSDNPIAKVEVLPQSSSRVRVLERRLAMVLGLSDQDLAMATDQLVETLTGPNASVTPREVGGQQKMQASVFAYFKALRSEFDTVVEAAQSYTSRNAMLEATITTIKGLHISATPIVTRPTAADIHTTIDRNTPLRDSPIDGEIEMDVERTEAARAARQSSSTTPSAQPQPIVRPPSIQPPDASRSVGVASSTPTQPTFFAQQTDSPQRKRQRTLTSGGTPEPLPRDDILHVYIRLVSATYKVQPVGGASGDENAPAGQKQLVCKLCEIRRRDQPGFPVAIFPYDRDTLPSVPPLADAEPTRTRVQPWIDHIQQKHQKMYSTIIERARPRSSTTASAVSTS
ncbi:unnamed protein product [Rhizoctonia solani]|uniref:Uncharacterized protein n=1 Tax=Rhizoctonia solani TaxID=456999 RepID=A0A8H3DLL6_9AGAM|nr:unnamed protein product [Rhizoctonia solani]